MSTRHRSFCFTLNNPTDDELASIRTTFDQENPPPSCVRFVGQLERGDSGTLHLQGYAGFSDAKTSKVFKQHVGRRAHVEPARGDPASNFAYCTKEEGAVHDDPRWPFPIFWGEFLTFGGRRATEPPTGSLRRADVIEYIATHPDADEPEVVEAGGLQVLATSPNLLPTVRSLLAIDERHLGVTCDLYIGAPGTGKSRLAACLFPTAYRKPVGNWWDGYAAERVVIFDDYDGEFMPLGMLLQVLDRYPYRGQVKGSFVKVVANHFAITTNLHPRDWYREAPESRIKALYRRFTHVLEFFENGMILRHSPVVYFHAWGPGHIFYQPPEVYIPPWAEHVLEPVPSPLVDLALPEDQFPL